MDALGFVLQQFYYFFASGLVINFYIVANAYVWKSTSQDCLPDYVSSVINLVSFNNGGFVFIFIVSAIIFSIIIVGFQEMCFQSHKKMMENSIRRMFLERWLINGTIWKKSQKISALLPK